MAAVLIRRLDNLPRVSGLSRLPRPAEAHALPSHRSPPIQQFLYNQIKEVCHISFDLGYGRSDLCSLRELPTSVYLNNQPRRSVAPVNMGMHRTQAKRSHSALRLRRLVGPGKWVSPGNGATSN